MDAFLEKLGVKKVGALAATFAAMKMTAVTAYTAGMLEPLNDLIEVRRCSHFHRSLKGDGGRRVRELASGHQTLKSLGSVSGS